MNTFKPFRYKLKSFGSGRKGGSLCGPNRRSRGIKLAQVAAKSGPSKTRAREKDSPIRASGDLAGGSRVKYIRRGPGKHWLAKLAVITRREGKEICNPSTPEGRAEYKWRVLLMWLRQDGLCCNCREPLKLKEATFEHEELRGKDRDERIARFDDAGRFIWSMNGASHGLCNVQRGSKRTPIDHGSNFVIERESA